MFNYCANRRPSDTKWLFLQYFKIQNFLQLSQKSLNMLLIVWYVIDPLLYRRFLLSYLGKKKWEALVNYFNSENVRKKKRLVYLKMGF